MPVRGARDATGMRRYVAGMLSRMPVECVSHRVQDTHSALCAYRRKLFGFDTCRSSHSAASNYSQYWVYYIYPIYRPTGLLLGSCPGGSWPSCERHTLRGSVRRPGCGRTREPAPGPRARCGPACGQTLFSLVRVAAPAPCPRCSAPAGTGLERVPLVARGVGGRRTGSLVR